MSESRFQNPLDALAATSRRSPAVSLDLVQARARFSFRARDDAALDAAGAAFGVALPRQACRFKEADNKRALWLGPDEWLLTMPMADGPRHLEALEKALAGKPCSLVDVSNRSLAFTVAGPQAAAILNSGCPLDLSTDAFPVGMCTRTVLAKTEIILLRTAQDRFLVDVWRSFAPYAWSWLEEARREFV